VTSTRSDHVSYAVLPTPTLLAQLSLKVHVQLLLLLLLQDKVYSLSTDAKLDENCMADMIAAGYSRVLVYSGDNVANVRGYLQVLTLH
jgi:hypothetical protein